MSFGPKAIAQYLPGYTEKAVGGVLRLFDSVVSRFVVSW